ncbi:helix-turn-helix domain-containing protein [Exiguobacterium sp. TNDT2]|uniref:helix-turn-helix domain-containing protein n=1 Tax=Exiguobacterium sp. TNDT2 TaxID=2233531 RepID=UPI001300571D|nr:helix-turn-helix domain-containing protein [Exiguobacterium sp. TNDT2]
MLKDYKHAIIELLEKDSQLKKIEVTSELISDRLKLHASIRRTINALKEYEQTLDLDITEQDQKILNKYTMSEDLVQMLPKYLSVAEVGKLLAISPQMVRRKCMHEEIEAYRTLNGKGKWRIPSAQFIGHQNLEDLILEYKHKRQATHHLASTLTEPIDDGITSDDD